MARISINLLPVEFTLEEVKRSKFVRVQAIGVAVILIMVFLSSLTVALRILQSQNIEQIQTRVVLAEGQIDQFKGAQGSLILLKNRLSTINQYLGKSSKQTEVYQFIDSITPPSVSITSISIDKTGDVSIAALARDIISLDNFISGLSDEEISKGKVSRVSVESLNLGRDGVYRVNFKIKLKL